MYKILCAAIGVLIASSAPAAFVPDEFDTPTLGSQWVWNPGSTTGTSTSTITMTGTKARVVPAPGCDNAWTADNYAYLEQDAPAGTNWEVITKVDDFNCSRTGYQLPNQKVGLMVYQDGNHWVMADITGNSTGTPPAANNLGLEGIAQIDYRPGTVNDGKYEASGTEWGITSATVYLKLQKTTKGYLGFASPDGVNWGTVTPLMRNPETSATDGMFSHEKIRLVFSGGSTTARVAAPGDIDYVHVQSVASYDQPYKDDDFSSTTLDPAWMYVGGVFPGEYNVSGGNLNMLTDQYQEMWWDVDRPQFVIQNAPTQQNYSLAIHATPNDYLATPAWTGYAIRIWQDQNDWFYIGMFNGGTSNTLQAAYQYGNSATQAEAPRIAMSGTSPGPAYLRVDRSNNRYRAQYSFDGILWTVMPFTGYSDGWVPIPNDFTNAQVELCTKRPNAEVGRYIWINFDYIHMLASAASDWQLLE